MEGTTSISLRYIIFRELVANIIAHREYTSAAPATMMVYSDHIEFKNPNVPHYHGRIDPGNFTPFPKNPTICKFMIQLGRYEELGSGVRKVNLYLPRYAPGAGKPVFEDGDMFKVTVPLTETGSAQVTPEVTPPVTPPVAPPVAPPVTASVNTYELRLLRLLDERGEQGNAEIRVAFGLKDRRRMRETYLTPALESGRIEMTMPDKPTSSFQKYRLTDKGRAALGPSKEV